MVNFLFIKILRLLFFIFKINFKFMLKVFRDDKIVILIIKNHWKKIIEEFV